MPATQSPMKAASLVVIMQHSAARTQIGGSEILRDILWLF